MAPISANNVLALMGAHALAVCLYIYSDYAVFLDLCDGAVDYGEGSEMKYKRNPAPDGHRCGVCPTYFQKICAFDFGTNATFIFDNHCVMDLYNCMDGTEFIPVNYDHCVYFGNFAYVHGHKYEDKNYGEDYIMIKDSQKSPPFVLY